MPATAGRPKKLASSASRTYNRSRNTSRVGLAGGRPVDAILRLCAQKLQQKRRRHFATDSPSEQSLNFLSPERTRSPAPAFRKDIFDFTSNSSNDEFDKLQKSGSFINPKYTAKKKQTRRPLRNRNAATVVIESSEDSIRVNDEESVLEMFPTRKKRKRKAKENVKPVDSSFILDAPKPKRGRKKEQVPETAQNKKKEVVETTKKKNQVTEKSVAPRSAIPRRRLGGESTTPRPFENPMFSPVVSTSLCSSVFGHPSGLKFQSTPLEGRAVTRQRFLPPGVSSIKKRNTLSQLPSPLGSPILSSRNIPRGPPLAVDSKTTCQVASGLLSPVFGECQGPSAHLEQKKTGSFHTCPSSTSSQSQDGFASAEAGKDSQQSQKPRDSETPDLFDEASIPQAGVSQDADVNVRCSGSDVEGEDRVRSGFTMSIGFDDHVEDVPLMHASFPTHGRRLPLGDLTMGCVREMRARFVMQDGPETIEEENEEELADVQDENVPPVEDFKTPCEVQRRPSLRAVIDEEETETLLTPLTAAEIACEPFESRSLSRTIRLNNDEVNSGEGADVLFTPSNAAESTPRARRRTTSNMFSIATSVEDESNVTPVVAEAAEASMPSAENVNRRRSVRVVLKRLSLSEVFPVDPNEVGMNRSRKPANSDVGVATRRSTRRKASTDASALNSPVGKPSRKKAASDVGTRRTRGSVDPPVAPRSPEILRDAPRIKPEVLLERLNIIDEEASKPPPSADFELPKLDEPVSEVTPPLSPVFKVPLLPGVKQPLNRPTVPRPPSVVSPGKFLRPRCSMRLNPPKISLPPGSISRVLEDELGVSCRTRSKQVSSGEELSSWVRIAMLLADPELSVRPEEATKLLIAAASTKTLDLFAAYASQLMRAAKQRKKIGEGTYGEVFCFGGSRGKKTVVKIIPTDGDMPINEAQPKKSLETVMEVLITGILSELRTEGENRCASFVHLRKISYLHGNYPRSLLKLWDDFAKEKETYNERPSKLPKDQRYVSMEMAHAGEDLESVHLRDASQGVAVLEQVAAALGVGELAAEFEHRDLHWGNILLEKLQENEMGKQDELDSDDENEVHEEFVLNGEQILVENRGVRVTIIDYSLSRMQVPGGSAMFNDLEEDPILFENYDPDEPQFEVYRDMREVTGTRWEEYHPRTNILWLLYLCDKLVFKVRYARTRSEEHKAGMSKLRQYRRKLEKASSANEFVLANMRSRPVEGGLES